MGVSQSKAGSSSGVIIGMLTLWLFKNVGADVRGLGPLEDYATNFGQVTF